MRMSKFWKKNHWKMGLALGLGVITIGMVAPMVVSCSNSTNEPANNDVSSTTPSPRPENLKTNSAWDGHVNDGHGLIFTSARYKPGSTDFNKIMEQVKTDLDFYKLSLLKVDRFGLITEESQAQANAVQEKDIKNPLISAQPNAPTMISTKPMQFNEEDGKWYDPRFETNANQVDDAVARYTFSSIEVSQSDVGWTFTFQDVVFTKYWNGTTDLEHPITKPLSGRGETPILAFNISKNWIEN